jgi:hypothetical protein
MERGFSPLELRSASRTHAHVGGKEVSKPLWGGRPGGLGWRFSSPSPCRGRGARLEVQAADRSGSRPAPGLAMLVSRSRSSSARGRLASGSRARSWPARIADWELTRGGKGQPPARGQAEAVGRPPGRGGSGWRSQGTRGPSMSARGGREGGGGGGRGASGPGALLADSVADSASSLVVSSRPASSARKGRTHRTLPEIDEAALGELVDVPQFADKFPVRQGEAGSRDQPDCEFGRHRLMIDKPAWTSWLVYSGGCRDRHPFHRGAALRTCREWSPHRPWRVAQPGDRRSCATWQAARRSSAHVRGIPMHLGTTDEVFMETAGSVQSGAGRGPVVSTAGDEPVVVPAGSAPYPAG